MNEVKILFVDDEPNILNTLRRLMRLEGFTCDFANNAEEALALLRQNKHEIVISDMRMPNMNGDELMTKVREIQPLSLRFILSGYTDFSSMMNALNHGGVHQFIAKPWNDDLLVKKLHEAVEFVRVRKERDHLRKLTQHQAKELKQANQALEARVESRTQELKQTADMLDLSLQELKSSYNVFIDVIAQVLQLRSIAPKDHLNDIADTAQTLCRELHQSHSLQDDVYKAAKLHELGKIAVAEAILKKPLDSLRGKELQEYQQYPMHGYTLLTSLDHFSEAATLVLAHCESFNGYGFPMRLANTQIPLGARIIGIVMHYFLYRNGLYDGRVHTSEECEVFIRKAANKKVDPNLVEPFLKSVKQQLQAKGLFESRIDLHQAKPGQVLSRDLYNTLGIIMLTKGSVLTEKNITKLIALSEKDKANYVLYIANREVP